MRGQALPKWVYYATALTVLAAGIFATTKSHRVYVGSTIGITDGRTVNLVDRVSNAHFLLPADWFLQLLSSVSPTGNDALAYYYIFLLLVLGAGAAIVAVRLQGQSPLQASAVAACFLICADLAWQRDLGVLAAFSWFPWLWLAKDLYARLTPASQPIKRWVAFWSLLAVSSLSALTAQFLAIVPACLALMHSAVFSHSSDPESGIDRRRLVGAALLLAPALLTLSISAPAPIPHYPPLSHVVRDDGMLGLVQPLLSRDMPLQLIDRDNVKAYFAPVASGLAGFSLLVLLINLIFRPVADRASACPGRSGVAPRGQTGMLAAFALAVAGVGDTLLREPFAQLMPIAVVSRLVPGLLYFPLVSLILFAAFYCLAFLSHRRSTPAAVLLVLPVALFGFRSAPGITPVGPQAPTSSEIADYISNLEGSAPTAVISPSFFPVAREGLHIISERSRIESAAKVAAHTLGCSARDSSSKDPALASDGNFETRWTSSTEGQHAAEWIELACPKQQYALGVELSTGRWGTDFPRGLRIRTGESCDGPLETRYENDSWQGAVHYSPAGYPHYQSQGHVRVHFRSAVPVGCVRAEQIGSDPVYDWSVAEISFYGPR